MYLQGRLGADLYRIHTKQDYPNDYQAMVKQAALEQKQHYKPTLKEDLTFLNSYDILLVGTPLWSLSLSSPIRTLLAKTNLKGKKIAPFITNAGYKFGRALKEIESLTNAKILRAFEMKFDKLEKTNKHLKQWNENLLISGVAFNSLPKKEIESWILVLKIL